MQCELGAIRWPAVKASHAMHASCPGLPAVSEFGEYAVPRIGSLKANTEFNGMNGGQVLHDKPLT